MRTRARWLFWGSVICGAGGLLAIMGPPGGDLPGLRITLPAPDLTPHLAALAGVWEPTAGGGAGPRVVVARIDETRATLLHYRPNHPAGHPSGGWDRVRARVLRDGGVQWDSSTQFTLRLAEGGATLEEQNEAGELVTRLSLKKVPDLGGPW